jgi:hypothetical protein
VFDSGFDHGFEIGVVMAACADVTGIDAKFSKRASAFFVLFQKYVAVIVKVSDYGNLKAALTQRFDYAGDGFGGLSGVYRYADEFRACAIKLFYLMGRRLRIYGVGIGHRLNDDGVIAAHADASDADGD